MTEYVPGVCNIGGAERGRRMRLGILAAAFFVVGLVLLLALGWPAWLRLGLALPAAGAAANVLQVRRRFCAGFAWAGVANFGPVGELARIADTSARDADRRAALRLGVEAFAIGVAVAVATLLL